MSAGLTARSGWVKSAPVFGVELIPVVSGNYLFNNNFVDSFALAGDVETGGEVVAVYSYTVKVEVFNGSVEVFVSNDVVNAFDCGVLPAFFADRVYADTVVTFVGQEVDTFFTVFIFVNFGFNSVHTCTTVRNFAKTVFGEEPVALHTVESLAFAEFGYADLTTGSFIVLSD